MANNNSNGGTSICTLLLILFIALKLCKVITWSWLWVLSPLWIPFGIFFIAITIRLFYDIVKYLIRKHGGK